MSDFPTCRSCGADVTTTISGGLTFRLCSNPECGRDYDTGHVSPMSVRAAVALVLAAGKGDPEAVATVAAARRMGSDAARAVGRFREDGPSGYRAHTAPDAPLRETRPEAVEDERAWLEVTR